MPSISCARCGTTWATEELEHGELRVTELRCFFEGLGCPWCWSGLAPQTDDHADRFLRDCLAATTHLAYPCRLLDGLAAFRERQTPRLPVLLLRSAQFPARRWTVHA